MDNSIGEMAEWLKALAWKACIPLKVSRVRIPFSPPSFFTIFFILTIINLKLIIFFHQIHYE